jgi:lipoprotein-releasing system permease protein
MNLIFDIAWTHVRSRVRQTGFAVAGVATGVGFSIMMASLMQGSQDDFTARLVNTLPHISVTDERRAPPPQPAEKAYGAAQIHGLTPEARRPGIKNPLATMAALEAWLPGTVGPSVKVPAIIRYANKDVGVSVIGIDPRREAMISDLPRQLRGGVRLAALYTATNAVFIGDGLAAKLGARIGANVTMQTSEGVQVSAHVAGFFHSGVKMIDDGTVYVLIKTGQVLSRQTGLVNELRVRLRDPLIAREIAARVESDTSYKSVSWQESNEDLLSTFLIRNLIMYTVVGAILLVASFGTYNIISTITHEKARDIAIMKSLGLSEFTVRSIFVVEALIIGLAGAIAGFALGYLLCLGLGQIRITNPFLDSDRLPLAYTYVHYVLAGGVALVSSVAAGYQPARHAARAHPVEIIRGAT